MTDVIEFFGAALRFVVFGNGFLVLVIALIVVATVVLSRLFGGGSL